MLSAHLYTPINVVNQIINTSSLIPITPSLGVVPKTLKIKVHIWIRKSNLAAFLGHAGYTIGVVRVDSQDFAAYKTAQDAAPISPLTTEFPFKWESGGLGFVDAYQKEFEFESSFSINENFAFTADRGYAVYIQTQAFSGFNMDFYGHAEYFYEL